MRHFLTLYIVNTTLLDAIYIARKHPKHSHALQVRSCDFRQGDGPEGWGIITDGQRGERAVGRLQALFAEEVLH